MLQLLTNSPANTYYGESGKAADILHLRFVERQVVNYKNTQLPKGKTVHEIIASYAFSIFGLSKAAAFPAHFRVPVLSAPDKEKIDIAVELFHSIKKNHAVAAVGEIEINFTASYFSDLGQPDADGVMAISKTYEGKTMLFVFNSSKHDAVEKFICLSNREGNHVSSLRALYGYDPCGKIVAGRSRLRGVDIEYVKLYLRPGHLAILISE